MGTCPETIGSQSRLTGEPLSPSLKQIDPTLCMSFGELTDFNFSVDGSRIETFVSESLPISRPYYRSGPLRLGKEDLK